MLFRTKPNVWFSDMAIKIHMRTFKIISFYILIAIPQFLFFIPYTILADKWGLDNQSLKYEWGLEEQTLKHEKSDSIILHYNGKEWKKFVLNTNKRLMSVCVADSNEVFVVGADGLILHYDGINWTRQRSGTNNWLRRIWSVDSNNIFAVGDDGTILLYDGTKWNKQKSGTNYLLFGIWGDSKDNIYVVGISSSSHYNHMLDVSYGTK